MICTLGMLERYNAPTEWSSMSGDEVRPTVQRYTVMLLPAKALPIFNNSQVQQ